MKEFGQQLKKQDSSPSKRKYRKYVPEKEFIIMNDEAQVWSGLEGGYP